MVVVIVLSKCRNRCNANKRKLNTHRTWSSSSQREFEKRSSPEINLPCEKNLRTDSLIPDKDLEAGFPQASLPASFRSDSNGLTPRGGDLHMNGISHPYTNQSANKSVQDFSYLIDHINQADRLGRGPLLNTLYGDRYCHEHQSHITKTRETDRVPSMLLTVKSQNQAKAPAQSRTMCEDKAYTPTVSYFS